MYSIYAQQQRRGGVPVSYDYTITNNAEWGTIPAGILANGGTVGVAPGNYSNITLSATPSAMLTITGTDPNNMPIIDKLALGPTLGNVTLTDMRVVTSSWTSGPVDPITMGVGGGTCVISGTVNLEGLFITGNYQSDIDAYLTYDYTSHNYPEYACIPVTVTGGSYPVGVIDLSTSTSKYVGGLVADGTNIPLTAQLSGGTGFVGVMDVTGGVITRAEITSGGTGYADTTAATVYSAIGWTGRNVMLNYTCNAIGGKMSVPSGATFNFHNNTIKHVGSGFKPAFGGNSTSGTLSFVNNEIDGYYVDGISFSLPTQPTSLEYKWNRFTRHYGRVTDANNPHGDALQTFMLSGGTFVPLIRAIGNEALNSSLCRSDAQQFLFFSDANLKAHQLYAVGNCGLLLAPNGISADVASNSYIYGNTSLPGKPSSSDHATQVSVLLSNGATTQAYGQSLIEGNIAEDARVGATASSRMTVRNNTKTGLITNSSNYNTYFGVTTDPTTIAEMRTMRKGVGASADYGAYRNSSWINHAAQTHDPTLEPSFVKFPTVINQTASSTASSAWCRLIGGPDSQSVSVSGGTFDTATSVDLAGTATGVTSGLTSATLARDTWVRMNVATASTGSTATTATMTIRGTYSFDFNAITATASSYTIADNQNAAYSRVTTLPTFTGGVGFIWAARVRVDSYPAAGNSRYVFCNQTGTNFHLQYISNQWRMTMKNSSSVAARWSMTQQVGTMVTLIAAIDLTQSDKEAALRMFSNGNQLGHASGGTYNNGLGSLSNTDLWSTQSMGVLATSGGANVLDGAIEWLWFDIYTSIGSMPDVGDPAVLAEFSTDKFASDGSTTVLPQPKLFYGGTSSLSLWDSNTTGFPNGGSLASAPLIRQGATSYV